MIDDTGNLTRGGWRAWAAVLLAALTAMVSAVALAHPADSAVRVRISVSPQGVAPGASVTTEGHRFAPRTRGTITFADRTVARFTTSARGSFVKRWTVPAGARSAAVMATTASRRASTWLRVQQPSPPPAVEGERWSDPDTWGGALPQHGQTVTVPAGKTVVLDTSPPRLGGLQVDGTLLFEDRDLTLQSDWIMVHGRLQVGTELDPFLSRARIVLTGDDKTQNVMNMGAKVLGVMGGTLEVHGERRAGWTRLAATAHKGSSELTLAGTPGWRAGDKIVVASTDYDPMQAEERTVTAVSGQTVRLDRPLAHTHWGTVQTFADTPVDERAEVALLSRNVTIQGEESTSTDGFGGQIMVMGGGVARVEGAELTRMGQQNILRRYPIHYHMLGESGASSYLKDTSIHHTFNRCVTVHGTNRLTLTGNVCHDHLGHGYFFEDGAEVDNLVEGNLGLTTRRPPDGERLLPSDDSPATFWVTNPDNVLRDNVAAGSQGKGFWLAFPEHPTGLFAKDHPSETAAIWPRRTPLGGFSGNVAHSNGGDGLHVDGGPKPDGSTETTFYYPREDPANTGSTPVVARFENFVGYKNRGEAVWLRGRNHRLTGATLADNAIGATFASEESFLTDSLVVGETMNPGNPPSWETKGLDGRSLPRSWEPDFPIRGFEFYDGRVGARGTTFVNFASNGQRRASGLGVLLEDAFSLHPRNVASALRFLDAERVYLRGPAAGKDGDNSAVFVDEDGSVTGSAGSVVTANNPFLVQSSCSLRTEWNAYVCPPGTEHVSLISEAHVGGPAAIKPLTITREPGGETQTLMGCCDDSTSAITNLLPNQEYALAFNGGTPSRASFVLWHGPDRWLRLSMPRAEGFKVTKYGCDLAGTGWCGNAVARNIEELEASTRSGYFYDTAGDDDPATGTLHLKLVSEGADWEALVVEPR